LNGDPLLYLLKGAAILVSADSEERCTVSLEFTIGFNSFL
jgi:hypothetical protein